jgi:TolB protein
MWTRARVLPLLFLALLTAACGEEEKPQAQTTGGGQIVFTVNKAGRSEIWLMDATGRARRRLTKEAPDGADASGSAGPAWSPRRDRIAFVGTGDAGDENANHQELYVMDADGTNVKRLTVNDDADASPSWSPDGRQLVFARAKRIGQEDVESFLYLVNAGGSGERVLRHEPRGKTPVFLTAPAWSPDGKRIAFTRVRFDEEPDAAVYVMDADGKHARKLVDEAVEPDWSPDGTRIALASYRDRVGQTCFHECSPNSELYVVDADGGHLRRLTTSLANEASPTWSPDGKRIAFVSDRSNRDDHEFELYVVDAGGGDPQRITRNDVWDLDPDWG